MDDKVTAEDRAWFLAQVRTFFPHTDEIEMHVTRLALPRLGEFRSDAFRAAVTDYVTRWSGRSKRFIVGYFLDQLGERDEKAKRRMQALAELAARERRAIETDAEARRIREERAQLRRICEEASPERIEEAIAFLQECGWSRPPESISDWSPLWIVAVSDILTDATWPDIHAEPIPVPGGRPHERMRDDSVRISCREALRKAGPPTRLIL